MKIKGYYSVDRDWQRHSEYRKLRITVYHPNVDGEILPYWNNWVIVSFQTHAEGAGDERTWVPYYGMTIGEGIDTPRRLDHVTRVAKVLMETSHYGTRSFVRTPAEVIAALEAAGYRYVIYHGPTAKLLTPGDWWIAAHIAVPGSLSEQEARGAIFGRLNRQAGAEWVGEGCPIEVLTVPELDAQVLDPNASNRA